MDKIDIKSTASKLMLLQQRLKKLNKVAVAFSGGVDSALLLAVAHSTLGDSAIAITAASDVIPLREQEEARLFCLERGIQQLVYVFDELSVPGFSSNPPDRCYFCKKALFTGLLKLAEEQGSYALVEGSNMDDKGDYRPGLKALKELQVISPLQEAGLTKDEIRYLANILGLKEWNKPSYACLASRFPYSEEITALKLKMVEDAEQLLYDLGMRQFRVRIHGNLARIEVLPEDMPIVLEHGQAIDCRLKQLGFSYTALDLGGYSSGNMNIELKK